MSEQSWSLAERLREALVGHEAVAFCVCGAMTTDPDGHLADVAAGAVAEYVADRERAAEVRAWDEGWAARAEFPDRRSVPLNWPDINPYRRIETEERA